MDKYTKQANDFIEKTNVKITITFLRNGHYFMNETEFRNIYKITIQKNGKDWVFNFGDNINNTEKKLKPTSYDILASLTKNDPGEYKDFCDCYGYTFGSKDSIKIYNSVVNEYKHVINIWSDEGIELLQEIY